METTTTCNAGAYKYTCMSIDTNEDDLQVVNDAELYGIDEAMVQETSFASLSKNIHNVKVVRVMESLLHRLCVIAAGVNGETSVPVVGPPITIQRFLASYTVAFHPMTVFESIGEMEYLLTLKATKMVQVVGCMRHDIIQDASRQQKMENASGLLPAILEYTSALGKWKCLDETRLIGRMKHELDALFSIEKHIIDSRGVDTSALAGALHSQTRRLFANASRIAGVAGMAQLQQVRAHHDVSLLLHNDRTSHTDSGGRTGDTISSVLPKCLTNEELNHEILLNRAFQLNGNGRPLSDNTLYSKVRESLDVAFWRSVQDDMMLTTPIYTRCVGVIAEIKNCLDGLKIPALAGSKYPLFNMDIVHDELLGNHAVFPRPVVSWDRYIQVIACLSDGVKDAHTGLSMQDDVSMSSKMETALRVNIQRLHTASHDTSLQPMVFVECLQVLLGFVKEACILSANKRIRLVSHELTIIGPKYLFDTTNKKLDANTMTLEVTRLYIGGAIESQVASKKVDMHDLICNNANTTAAYNTVVTTVVATAFFASNSDIFPETLRLDHIRFRNIHSDFELYTVVAAAVGIINVHLRYKKIETAEILQDVATCLLESNLRNLDLTGRILEMVETLSSGHLTDEAVSYIRKSLSQNLVVGSTVFNLTARRIKSVVFRALHNTAADILFAGLSPCVLAVIGEALSAHIHVLRQVLRVNLVVYASLYNTIIAETAVAVELKKRSV